MLVKTNNAIKSKVTERQNYENKWYNLRNLLLTDKKCYGTLFKIVIYLDMIFGNALYKIKL